MEIIKDVALTILMLLIGITTGYWIAEDNHKEEYQLTMINKNSVEIYSVKSDATYYTSTDSILYYINKSKN